MSRPLPTYRAQLALLVGEAPEGRGWLHETKYDGYRIGAALEGGRATLWSRNGKDWTDRFPSIARAVERLPARAALLDGEVAAVLPDGRTSFQALQQSFGGGAAPLAYFVFDLLHLDGADLTSLALQERKARLEALLARAGDTGPIHLSRHVVGDGAALHREACRRGLEGIVSKRARAPYRATRNGDWLKVKCLVRQELVVLGFTDPEGAARDGIGALLVGYREARGGPLRFAGKVGTGFTNASARALRARLAPLETAAPPFTPAPRGALGRSAHWVRPELVCEVAFTEWTDDGKARHPSFQGLREDKRAADVVRELPAAAPAPTPSSPPTSGRRPGSPRGPGAGRRLARGGRVP
jgi:bifunctional non-homologous end joining protein LigD